MFSVFNPNDIIKWLAFDDMISNDIIHAECITMKIESTKMISGIRNAKFWAK